MPGCELLLSPWDAIGMPAFGVTLSMPLSIPAAPDLIGTELALQFLTATPGANRLGLLASNGVRLRFDR